MSNALRKPKSVLIVDDSRSMRAWLRVVLEGDARLCVIGEASSAVEARDLVKSQNVDVMTLDVTMPGMDGIEFLRRLMRARPMPVVMMSSLTSSGSDAAIQALSIGAIDCMVKPTQAFGAELTNDICDRVYQAACTRPQHRAKAKVGREITGGGHQRGALIVIGASTGGVSAIETVLPDLDPAGPPVAIVQHMPHNFLESFAARLNRTLDQNVMLAREGLALSSGDIVLAPSIDMHTALRMRGDVWMCHHVPNTVNALHCPAVDVLFSSAVMGGAKVSAAILTGIGRDGAAGLGELAGAGAHTIGQDAGSCVVYGMPRAAFEGGAVKEQLSIEKIGTALRKSRARISGS